MIDVATPTSLRAIRILNRIVFIELIRRKDLFIVGLMMGLFAVLLLAVRIAGIQDASTGTFLLNLGLTLAYYSSHLVILMLAVRQIPNELENRTIYSLMACPIRREWLVVSRFTASSICGVMTITTLFWFAWFASPKLETYDHWMLAQLVLLHFLSISLVVALGIFLSIIIPRTMAIAVTAGIFLAGKPIVNLLEGAMINSPFSGLVNWLLTYIPDFSRLNLITRYTDGIDRLNFMEFAINASYGLVVTLACIALSLTLFNKKSI
jgi:ABC-type transport system involved in multi-copper enzyme maturation permease subunit